MKLISYLHRNGKEQLAILVDDLVYNMQDLHKGLVGDMDSFLKHWAAQYPLALQAYKHLAEQPDIKGIPLRDLRLLSPVTHPTSLRDGYAFRQHVESARRNRGAQMIAQFDEYPVFYFSNHQSVQGAGEIKCMPDHFQKLDFELECAIVVCRKGRNIKANEAADYIGGLMVMNDISARTLQMEEMLLNLGPAKGKDFATILGPWLVTTEELKAYEVPCKPGHIGQSWNLAMTAKVNGNEVSRGNLSDMDWTFAELIERASYGVTLSPGDVIGSGTVGTGCFLELNGTGKLHDGNYKEQWLQAGDTIELEIAELGKLVNKITAETIDHSILENKKHAVKS
ncbi:fumarylacetoacetate hydrolase family protein [Danxiaibacter flavus]|uniref:Fumarylacetoacetate hydrolase family protein n=1 Tax=Danxiaibacter flavus TaxID=3049108 RepID=A0ABV3ZIC7_9BACT|nr:fumarylacetoacetate hydrolase family protein [Chitinophagaceae bacterium DXS]